MHRDSFDDVVAHQNGAVFIHRAWLRRNDARTPIRIAEPSPDAVVCGPRWEWVRLLMRAAPGPESAARFVISVHPRQSVV